MEVEEFNKIKGYYARQINSLYDNEVFDSDIDSAIGEQELNLLRLSSKSSFGVKPVDSKMKK